MKATSRKAPHTRAPVRADPALRASEKKFRDVFVSSPIGMALLDLRGFYIDVNQALLDLHGFKSKQHLIGKHFGTFVAEYDRVRSQQHWAETLAEGSNTRNITVHLLRKDGSVMVCNVFGTRLHDTEGAPRTVLAMVDDITDLKNVEAQLRASEEQARLVFQHAPSGICEIDVKSRRFVDVNERMSEFTGYTREELLGMNPSDLLDEEGKAQFRERMRLRENGEKAPWSMEYLFVKKDGEVRYASVTTALMGEIGSSPRLLGVIHDITARRLVDESKNNFIATMSHELRNPLAPVVAGVELARVRIRNEKESSPLLQEVDEILTIIEDQSKNMTHLLEDLLDISRIDRGLIQLEKKKTDIVAVAKRAVLSVDTLMSSRAHTLFIELPKRPLMVDIDPVRIEQVMVNLLNNAAKYTNPGGHVWLKISRESPGVIISVRDDGVGLEHDMIDNLLSPSFKKIRTFRSSSGGLGIGLKITKDLMELHGGTIRAESRGKDKGSEFIVELPMSD